MKRMYEINVHIPIIVKTRFAKGTGKRKQLTTLNSMHSLFDQALRAPKQIYDKQHGKAKGTISGQASVRTTQHNMTDETCSGILNHHDILGENSGKLHGWQWVEGAEARDRCSFSWECFICPRATSYYMVVLLPVSPYFTSETDCDDCKCRQYV